MKIIDCEQYSVEWWQAKKGVPSASNFDRILTAKTGKASAQAEDYIAELIADLHTDLLPERAELAGTRAMRNGLELEPEARRWYALVRDVDVQRVGFCVTDDGRFGCSPDGLVGDEGGLELKCPLGKTQVKYLRAGTLPDEYRPQVHGALIVSGRPWWDFLSYCPGLPPLLIRVRPDDYTERLRQALESFWADYKTALANIRTYSTREPLLAL